MTDLVADSYADIPTFRTFIRNSGTSDATDPDTALELLALEAAARSIDVACNRTFRIAGDTATARTFTPVALPGYNPLEYTNTSYPYALSRFPYSWYRHYILPIDDLADPDSITSVKFDSTGDGDYTETVTGYRVGPSTAAATGRPYSKLIFDSGIYPPVYDEAVEVTAKWGWAAIPTTIQQANLIQAARFLKRRDAAFGIAGSPEMGNELRLLAKLDPDVALMVSPFKKNWAVA